MMNRVAGKEVVEGLADKFTSSAFVTPIAKQVKLFQGENTDLILCRKESSRPSKSPQTPEQPVVRTYPSKEPDGTCEKARPH